MEDKSYTVSRILPKGFQPSDDVVMIGRGKRVKTHSGNTRMLDLVKKHLQDYAEAPHKAERSYIVNTVLDEVRAWTKDKIGFVKYDPDNEQWFVPTDKVARVIVSQAFRDTLSTGYKSSRQSKQKKRQIAMGYANSLAAANPAMTSCDSSSVHQMEKQMMAPIYAQSEPMAQGLVNGGLGLQMTMAPLGCDFGQHDLLTERLFRAQASVNMALLRESPTLMPCSAESWTAQSQNMVLPMQAPVMSEMQIQSQFTVNSLTPRRVSLHGAESLNPHMRAAKQTLVERRIEAEVGTWHCPDEGDVVPVTPPFSSIASREEEVDSEGGEVETFGLFCDVDTQETVHESW